MSIAQDIVEREVVWNVSHLMQRVVDRPFEMAVRAFDGAVLMHDAGIVAGRSHAVMAKTVLQDGPVQRGWIGPSLVPFQHKGKRNRSIRFTVYTRQCVEAMTGRVWGVPEFETAPSPARPQSNGPKSARSSESPMPKQAARHVQLSLANR